MSIKAQLREIRYSGAIVRSRKGKWRVKDPSGIIHEEPIPTEDKLSDDSVRCFVGRAFRNYAYRVLSADQAIIGFAGSQATWKQGDLILMAKANYYHVTEVTLSISNAAGRSIERTISETKWPDPMLLSNFRDELISDHYQTLKLGAYLKTHSRSSRLSCGIYIGRTLNVHILKGKPVFSCYQESDFASLHDALTVLEGFDEWCATLKAPSSSEPEVLETTLDLV